MVGQVEIDIEALQVARFSVIFGCKPSSIELQSKPP